MLGPSRRVPRIGGRAHIKHFGGGIERATVVAVREEGARLSVEDENGKMHEFVLSTASARFVSARDAYGPRLELLGGD